MYIILCIQTFFNHFCAISVKFRKNLTKHFHYKKSNYVNNKNHTKNSKNSQIIIPQMDLL